MIIMAKFQKRLRKMSVNSTNALVIGHGFGKIEDIVQTFNSVFITFYDNIDFKSKNLIYREKIDDLSTLVEIGAVFIDLKNLNKLSEVMPMIRKYRAPVLIEGRDMISKELAQPLIDFGYRPTDQSDSFYVWKPQV
jgi:hypothetical protein